MRRLIRILTACLAFALLLEDGTAQAAAAVDTTAAADPETLAEATRLLHVDSRRAFEVAGVIERRCAQAGQIAERAMALAIQCRAAVRSIGPEIARERHATARQILQGLPVDQATTARARVAFAGAIMHWTLDEPPECLTELRQAMDLAEIADDPYTQASAQMLALTVVGWPDNADEEVKRLEALAARDGDPMLALAIQAMRAIDQRVTGELEPNRVAFEALLQTSRQLSDRATEAYAAIVLANHHANDDAARAHDYAQQSLAASRRHGDREQIADAQMFLAGLEVGRDDTDLAMAHARAAVKALEGMEMSDAMMKALDTAARVASFAGDAEATRNYSRRYAELERAIKARARVAARDQLWSDVRSVREELVGARAAHDRELAEVEARMRTVVIAAVSSLALILAAATAMLLRNQRRLRAANARLERSIHDSEVLRREREALSQNLQQLERLDSIGQLAGGFAHDFNNILVAVRGNAQLLLADDKLDVDQREMLEQVLEASARAAGLCKDILCYANAAPTPTSDVDVREIIDSVAPLARAGFGACVELHLELGDDESITHADRSQLEQVFLNLLVNAGDAIQEHGHIHVTVYGERLAPGTQDGIGQWFGELPSEPSDYVAISVLDDGQGMSPETVRRIFDPFFSTRFAGRGLGLATTFSILRRHQGIVQVQSKPGRGTQFTVYLPRERGAVDEPSLLIPQAPPPSDDRGAGSTAQRTTVLVVDDEPAICEVARSALERAGHHVLTASSGADAIDLAERHGSRIRVAVLDVTMPEIDGPELAETLGRKVPGLRVVMMTGHAPATVHAADGEYPLLLKPFDVDELQRTVRAGVDAATAS